LKIFEGAKAKTITPINLVLAIPTRTEEPISDRALLLLVSLEPIYLMKFIPIWLQNSTPKPSEDTKLTTNTAFCSIGNPYKTIFSIHMHPISSKKTKKTQRVIRAAIPIDVKNCKENNMQARPKKTFWKRTPLI
jgi:hypothetical protein